MLRSTLIAAFLLGSVALPAIAQEFTAVSTIDRVITDENEDGTLTTEYIAADQVTPGENLLYRLNYDNASSASAENVSLVMNVPSEVIFTEDSAQSLNEEATVEFSTDGGESFAPRGELTVDDDGLGRIASAEDITNIRWTFTNDIPVGAKGTISFEAIVR